MINRNNYEEFFLLYLDEELSEAERLNVDQFLIGNPDLKGEFELLKQTMLVGSEITFNHKELLYKQDSGISLNNYEEFFVLNVDGELSKKEQGDVGDFILSHPQLQKEFTELQQSKLEAENMTCPDKELLYRTEKERRFVPIMWMRVGAAAAVIGIIATTTWRFTNSSPATAPGTRVAANTPVNPLARKAEKNTIQAVTQPNVVSLNSKMQQIETEVKKPIEHATLKRNKTRRQVLVSDDIAVNTLEYKNKQEPKVVDEMTATVKKNLNNLPEKVFQPEKVVDVAQENMKSLTKAGANKEPQMQVVNVAYHEIDTEQDEENRDVYIGSTEISKGKLIGLFKKAKSLFDKKSKNDKLLQVANMQEKG